MDRRSIDDSKKEEGGREGPSEDPLVACTFIVEKYIHVPSSLSRCVRRSFRCTLNPGVVAVPGLMEGAIGGFFGGFVRFKLLCGDDAPGSLSRAFRGYEIFGHRESMME